MLTAASHVVIGLVGAVLLYIALFLRETEEGRLQNRLEKLWVDIDDLSKTALSRQTAFLQQISALANSGLNKIFGVRLFSAEAVSTSLCFSIGALSLLVAYIKRGRDISVLGFLIVGIISFLVGILPIPSRYRGFLWTPGLIFFTVYLNQYNDINNFLGYLIMLCGGFLCDVLFIAVSRWCLRKGSELKSGWKIIALLTLNGCTGLLLVVSPIYLTWVLSAWEAANGTVEYANVVVTILLVAISNLFAGMVSFLFVVVALTALAHLAVWPILERPVYALQRYGLVRQPKMLAAASVTCLVFAWPHSPIIQAITKLVHG